MNEMLQITNKSQQYKQLLGNYIKASSDQFM